MQSADAATFAGNRVKIGKKNIESAETLDELSLKAELNGRQKYLFDSTIIIHR